MLRVYCSQQDLLKTRFLPSPSPLVEMTTALMVSRRQDNALFDPWRQAMRASYPDDARPLFDLIFPDCGPDYLDSLQPTFEAGLDDVLSGPPEVVRRPFEVIRRPAAPWVRRLADGDREAQEILRRALESVHDKVFSELWPRVVASYQADLAYRQPMLITEGMGAVMKTILPEAKWHGSLLELPSQFDRDVHLYGNGILFLPSAFWTGRPLVSFGAPDRPLLVMYPSRIPLPLIASTGQSGRSLVPLIGRTRAAVLDAIVTSPAMTTSELAKTLGISAGRASEHATVLRQAGLVTSHRHRNTVLHSPTSLGNELNPS